MGKEIERKFLVKNSGYQESASGVFYKQGYLSTDAQRTVRVRIQGNQAFITVKSKPSGLTRQEYEYEIPVGDAEEMLEQLCFRPLIEKHRYKVQYLGFCWEVDEFHGDNQGLVTAEIELKEESDTFEIPDWVGEEVTGDYKYQNSNLALHPYKEWKVENR